MGTLRLNVPVGAARLVVPAILPGFLAACPDVRVEVVADDGSVDRVSSGYDADIRYDERLEQDMIAVPIGPRVRRFATAASPAYPDARGRPGHPRDLLAHACLHGRFTSGALTSPGEFERDGKIIRVEPQGPLIAGVAGAAGLLPHVAPAGGGVISYSKTGFDRRSMAERWNRRSRTGGRHFRGRSCTMAAAVWSRRPAGPS